MIKTIVCALALCTFSVPALADLPKIKPGDPLPANLFIELAKEANPAVVNVFTTYLPKEPHANGPYNDPLFNLFQQFMGPSPYGMQQEVPAKALGSGFIIRDDGLIVTNNHVIAHADIIKVQLTEKSKRNYDAKVIGTDPGADIALIKIHADHKLPYLKMGDSAKVQVGEWVAAFGNPYGYGHTMTKGIISAKGRELGDLNLYPFMQTDASINPGNSGGPLLNTEGHVIGVNTAIDARAQGIGFVIPINNVKRVLPQLEKTGTVERGFIGVEMADIDEESARSLHLHLKDTSGALVTQVLDGLPAEKAGLKPYDLIVGFNGTEIDSGDDLRKAVATTSVGQTVPIKIIRNGRAMTLKIRVGSRAEMQAARKRRERRRLPEGVEAPLHIGFRVTNYSRQLSQQFGIPILSIPRPVVVEVDPASPAAQAGLAPGDVILDVNRKPAHHVHDVTKNLKRGITNIMRVLKQDRVVLISIRVR